MIIANLGIKFENNYFAPAPIGLLPFVTHAGRKGIKCQSIMHYFFLSAVNLSIKNKHGDNVLHCVVKNGRLDAEIAVIAKHLLDFRYCSACGIIAKQ